MESKKKRALASLLSLTMISSTLFYDFTPLAAAEETDKTEISTGLGNLTSAYISTNINDESGQNASYMSQNGFEDLLFPQLEEMSVVSTFSLGDESGISCSDNEMMPVIDFTDPEMIKEILGEMMEGVDDITPAGEYDENGLAASYHYITLNYTLVDDYAVWPEMTIQDIWEKVPESFVASYVTTIGVYTIRDNEDYYVALANPASINGMGEAIYAEFTDGNTENPTVYNNKIAFDEKTGLIYVPKSFYYNEYGEEVLRSLEAQILVPYSMDDEKSIVYVSGSSEVDGVDVKEGKIETEALDVTITLPLVNKEDADKISIKDLYVTVNDDRLPFDLTNGGGYYDQETGELTIAAAGNTVYSVDVQIKKGAEEEILTSNAEKEILVASIGDISGFIAMDKNFYGDVYYATSAAEMKTLQGVSITAEGVVRGQTYTYSGAYEYVDNYSITNTDIPSKIITATAPYCYYYISGGKNTMVDGINMGGVKVDGSVTINNVSTGSTALLNTAKPDSTFNRIASLPDNTSLTSTNGAGTITWDCNITSNPANFDNYVALHCAASATAATGVADGTGNLTIRILYYKAATQTSDGYMVFSLSSPTVYTQAGCAVYKVEIKIPENIEYYARFGINKVSSQNPSTKLAAHFVYDVSTTDPAYNKSGQLNLNTNLAPRARYAKGLYDAVASGTFSQTNIKNNLVSYFDDVFITSTSGVGMVTLNSDNCSSLANFSGDSIYVTIAEVYPPEGYNVRTGVWVLKITPSRSSYSDSSLDSVTYYAYDTDTDTLSSGTSVSKTSYYFNIDDTPKTYYAKVGFDKYEYNPDNTATSRLANAVIGITTDENKAKNGATNGGTGYASTTLITSSSSPVYYTLTLGEGVTEKTIYAYEASAPANYARNDGYWEIVLQGTEDNTGSGTKILSAVYHDYSASSGSWGEYTLSTVTHYNQNRGWYTQGSDTIIPIVHLTDKVFVSHSVEKLFANTGTKSAVKNITAELYRNNTATGKTVTLNEVNSWKYTWTELDKYDSNGVAYTYTVKEIKVNGSDNLSGYSINYDNSKTSITTITNTLKTVNHTFFKNFGDEDSENAVTFVEAQLYRKISGGAASAVGNAVTVKDTSTSGGRAWSHKWTELPKYDKDGNEYIYFAKEIEVGYLIDGKTGTLTGDEISKYFITRTSNDGSEIKTTTTIENTILKTDISKLDITDSSEIPGATLQIIQIVDGEEVVVHGWISTEEPHRVNLPEGDYKLREITAPTDHGFVKAEDVEFTVDETGEVQTVTMYDDHTELRITKTDYVTGEEVKGATLQLIDSAGKVVVEWVTGDTSADGTTVTSETGMTAIQKVNTKTGKTELILEYVPVGTYTLRETIPAEGYATAEEVTVVVEEVGSKTIIQTAEMKDKPLTVEISKTDITTGEEIPGATLTIYIANPDGRKGERIVSWVTDGTPKKIEKLATGKYILEETQAPTADGYVHAEDVTFEVIDTEEIQKVNMKDDYTKVAFEKVDDNGNAVKGATLAIFKVNDGSMEEEASYRWVTDGSTFRIDRMPVGDYVLIEEVTPAGYLTSEPVYFTVEEIPELVTITMIDETGNKELPVTGGAGNMALYLLALLAAACATGLFVKGKKEGGHES